MSGSLIIYLHGALTLACFLVAVKFLKFWRSSRDRFFLWFFAAFCVFAAGWVIRVFAAAGTDHVYYVYMPRLVAFSLIITAILDKNRKQR